MILDVVKAGDQVCYGGFPGASAADNSGGFPNICRKTDIVQYRFFCAFILESNIAKFQLGFRLVLSGLLLVHSGIRIDSQHFVDTISAGLCPWKYHKYHNTHNEVHQNHNGILGQGHNVTDFHSAICNLLAAVC